MREGNCSSSSRIVKLMKISSMNISPTVQFPAPGFSRSKVPTLGIADDVFSDAV